MLTGGSSDTANEVAALGHGPAGRREHCQGLSSTASCPGNGTSGLARGFLGLFWARFGERKEKQKGWEGFQS